MYLFNSFLKLTVNIQLSKHILSIFVFLYEDYIKYKVVLYCQLCIRLFLYFGQKISIIIATETIIHLFMSLYYL